MSVRIIAVACAAVTLAGCAKPSDDGTATSLHALSSQGYSAYNRGDYRDAATYFEEALVIDPANDFATRGLAASRDGVLYFGDSRPVNRDLAAEKALYTASLQGYEAYARGDLADATARFEAILVTVPGNAYALRGLEAVGRKAAARGDTVVAMAPTAYATLTETRQAMADPVLAYDDALPVVAPSGRSVEGGGYVSVGSYDTYVSSDGGVAMVDASYAPVAVGDYAVDTVPVAVVPTVALPGYTQEIVGPVEAPAALPVGALSVVSAAGSDDGGLIYLSN